MTGHEDEEDEAVEDDEDAEDDKDVQLEESQQLHEGQFEMMDDSVVNEDNALEIE